MAREEQFRDSKWACFEAEVEPVRTVANMAYLGAQVGQVEKLVGKRLSYTAICRLFNLLSPNMRRPVGMRRSGGRPKGSRAIQRLPVRLRRHLIGILGDYHAALTAGADLVDARLAAWLVFDCERQAGLIDVDEDVITLDLWLLFVELLVKRRAVVCKCAVCGQANLVVDLDIGICVEGVHKLVDAGPFFTAPDGTDSPVLRDATG